MNDKIRIGLLVSHMEDHFTQEICRGARIAGIQENAEIIILPGRYVGMPANPDRRDVASECYPAVFNYAKETGISALVISTGTITCFLDDKERERFISYFSPMPIVSISMKVGRHPCVYLSEENGLREELEHMIKLHGADGIAYVTGPKDNPDAIKRRELYKKVLEEHGQEYDESKVGYGNFCRTCRSTVEPFMDKMIARGIRAFVFANDEMAAFGYIYAAEHDLDVGRDLFIAGYDDNVLAASLPVPLTSVRADASLLGYHGVLSALRMHRGEKVGDTKLDTSLAVRDSCGYNGAETTDDTDKTPAQIANEVVDFIIGGYSEVPFVKKSADKLKEIWTQFLSRISEPGPVKVLSGEARKEYETMMWPLINAMGPIERIPESVRMFYRSAMRLAKTQEEREKLFNSQGRAMWSANRMIMNVSEERMSKISNASYFADDVTYISGGGQRAEFYHAVVERLRQSNVTGACIYTYNEIIPNRHYDRWKKPEKLILRGRFDVNGEEINENGVEVASSSVFEPLGDGEGLVFAIPLTGSTEHFGLLVCRAGLDGMSYVHNVTSHLSVSVKIATLLDKLDSQLGELDRSAKMLRHLSVTDDLTGIHNRRGFLETGGYMVHNDRSNGKRGLMVYGDLDKFKSINDSFGHSEGDEALRFAAGMLSRLCDDAERFVCARVGGDEFAALMVLDDDETQQSITERLVDILNKSNETSGRPYRVDMSFGMVEFFCSPAVSLAAIMNQADSKQYIAKEKRRKHEW